MPKAKRSPDTPASTDAAVGPDEPAKLDPPAKATRPAKRTRSAKVTAPEPSVEAPSSGGGGDQPAETGSTLTAAAEPSPAKPSPAKPSPAKPAPGPRPAKAAGEPAFLVEQRALLLEERASYTKQADELKAEADSLALEHEPGDVQFDEEGGEGGTSNVDRELDLVLSAQARFAVAEIDRALAKLETGNYGVCEQCGQPIPEARLMALPYAALCVACKSGGLSRR